MAKLMWIAGILLAAIGVALGLMVFASPTAIVSWGITPEVAALLLVGGILSVGLGGVIHAVETLAAARPAMPVHVSSVAAESASIPEFGRRAVETATVAAAAAPAAMAEAVEAEEEVSEPVRETIQALEHARQKIEQAFEPKPQAEPSAPAAEAAPEPQSETVVVETVVEVEEVLEELHIPAEPEPEAVEEEASDEGQLYVVEERFIRARPARILSDGTVEAETEEGWMRFENLEHLDEYLDAMSTPAQH